MIGKSIQAYIGVRLLITLFRLVTPASFAWVLASSARRVSLFTPWLNLVAIPEILFYLCFYIPRRKSIQKAALHMPDRLTEFERRELFDNCAHNASNLPRWLLTSDVTLAGRDNVVDWILWAFFDTRAEGLEKEELVEWHNEIDSYVTRLEEVVGHRFPPGRNNDIKPMRLTIDPVEMVHRPLTWYLVVGIIELYTASMLASCGLKHYAPKKWFLSFPPRPWSFLSREAATPHVPYWFRPHRSTTKKPLIFIHGIGIGLFPYVFFMRELDPEVGVLLIELLPISSRITARPVMHRLAMLDAFYDTTRAMGIKEAVLVSHSYGTVVAGHILRSQQTHTDLPTRISSYCFIDPIPFLLHFPDITYNFLYRQPKDANEWLLWFFASQDADIGRALRRHFFWTENILFKEQLEKEKVAVVLSGSDQIVPSGDVWKYLTGEEIRGEEESPDRWVSSDSALEVTYYPQADHATVFNRWSTRKGVAEVIDRLCRQV